MGNIWRPFRLSNLKSITLFLVVHSGIGRCKREFEQGVKSREPQVVAAMDDCWVNKLCRALVTLRANRLDEHPLVGRTRHRWSRVFDLLCIDWTRDNWPCSAGSETSIAWRRQPFGKCVRNLYCPLSICYLDTVR